MGAEGFLGVPIPEEYGGAGMDYIAFALLCEEMERADTAFRVILSRPHRAQLADAAAVGQRGAEAAVPGPAGPRREAGHLRPDRARRRHDAANLATTARRDGDRYILNGSKIWISLADIGRPLPGLRHRRRAQGHKGITAFIVERGIPGLQHRVAPRQAGRARRQHRRSSPSTTCEVPAANRVGEEGEGFTIAMSAIDQGRYTVAAGAVGLAQACLDASVKYAHERKTFGEEIGRAPARQADDRQDGRGHRGRPAALSARRAG